ncbi:MAG TPA: hypothetical protein VKE27_08080 [Candidatus Dormibacteraeota bacterium]|nr:hypothetical protein [Candidatus Dormibacteraeota bacterium]
MEARQTLKGSAVPKVLLVALAMCAAAILAIGGSFIAKDLAGSGSTVNTSVHPAPGTVLRQDYQGPSAVQSTAPIRHKTMETAPGFREA